MTGLCPPSTAPDDAARLRHCEATIERVARALGMGDDASAGELVRAIERLRRERDDARSDAASTEYDLARLIVATRKVDAVPAEVCDLADEIASNGRSGWIARALDPAEVDPCRGVVRALSERAERAEAEVERLRGVLADAHPMLGRAVECEREHGGLRAQIETLTRERDEARAWLAAKTDAHDRDGRVLLAISKALGRHATGDTAADVRRLVATLSSTRAAMRVMRATSANLGPGELWNRMEQAEHECDAARRHEACLMAERDRLRTYLARALRGCDPRERRAIEADMASEEGGEHG